MPDMKEVYEMVTQQTPPKPDALERQHREQRRLSTKRQVGAYALVAGLVALAVVVAANVLPQSDETAPGRVDPTRLSIVDPETGRTTPVTGAPVDAIGLDVSPNGSTIAFSSKKGVGQIFTMGIDGSYLRQLTDDPHQAIAPDWSPNGDRIAYTAFGDTASRGIYVMDADGSNQTLVVNDPDADELFGEWSPDGTSIVFVREGDPKPGIYVVELSTGARTRLTREFGDGDPTWADDGASIVFARLGEAVPIADIWIMRADGSGERELVARDAWDLAPEWANGSVVFQSGIQPLAFDDAVTLYDVFVFDGSSTRLVIADVNGATWMPSGQLLVAHPAS